MDTLDNSGYTPGSRAIKIPLFHSNDSNPSTTSRARRGIRPHQAESADTSDGGLSSRSSSRTSETLLNTRNTAASPANIHLTSTTHTTTSSPAQSAYAQRKDKQKADLTPPNTMPIRTASSIYSHHSPMSPSMLSSSSYKSINLNIGMAEDDGPARIITYTKQSQGFAWNDELFLPSYLIGRRNRYGGSKARRRWGGEMDDDDIDGVGDFDEDVDHCPVTDIFVTDEEAAAMLP